MNLITREQAASIMGCGVQTFYNKYVKTDLIRQHPEKGTNRKLYEESDVYELKEAENG